MMKLEISKLRDYVESSAGQYSLEETAGLLTISFNTTFSPTQEHFSDATIRIYATPESGYAVIQRAEMDYGGGLIKAISLESLVPWLASIDEGIWDQV